MHRAGLASSFKDYAGTGTQSLLRAERGWRCSVLATLHMPIADEINTALRRLPESAQLYSEASQLMGATVNVVLEQRLGDALMHMHEYERAYVAYQRALSIPPSRTNTNATQHAHGLVRAAAAATYTGRIAEALERLVHLLENDARGLFFPSSSGAELAWAAIAQIGGSEGGSGTHLPQQVRQRLVATAVRLFVSRDSRVRASRRSRTLAAGDGRRPLWSEGSYKGAETHTGGRNVTADLGECQFLDEMPWLDAASIEDAVGLYARFHAASLGCCATARADGQARVDEGAHPLRMLVYRPSDAGEGWGNRLLSLSSSFVLAMATRRVFLVNWTEPTELSYLLAAPSGIDWSFAAASERCRRAGGRREEVTEAGFGAFMSFSLEQVYSDKQGILSRNHETGSRGADSGLLYSSLHDLFRPIKTLKAFAWFRRLCRQRRREAAGEDGWGPVGLGDGGESKWELFACTGWYLFAPSARVEAAMALRTKTLALQQDAGKSLVGVAVRRGSKLTSHYSVINRAGQDAILRCAALVLLGSGPGSRVVSGLALMCACECCSSAGIRPSARTEWTFVNHVDIPRYSGHLYL